MFSKRENFSIQKKTGLLIPINLAATNLARCVNCNKQFPFSMIQNHLKTHIGQDSIKQNYVHSTTSINPLKFQQCLSNASTTNQIQTQTIMASQLPNHQTYKQDKNKPVYTQMYGKQKLKSDNTSNMSVMKDDTQISSRINPFQFGLKKIQIESSDYFESIKIPQKKVNTKNKQINLYTKINSGISNEHTDNFVSTKKNDIKRISEKSYKYSIETISEQKNQYRNQEQKIYQITNNQAKLRGTLPTKFSTVEVTSPKSLVRTTNCSLHHQPSYQSDRKSFPLQNHSHDNNNCYCSCCGGFYCPVCKSTIPPQYRKITNPNSNPNNNNGTALNSIQKSPVTAWGSPV